MLAIASTLAPDLPAPAQAGDPGLGVSVSPPAGKLAKPRVKHGTTKFGTTASGALGRLAGSGIAAPIAERRRRFPTAARTARPARQPALSHRCRPGPRGPIMRRTRPCSTVRQVPESCRKVL